MNLKQYIFTMAIATALCVSAWIMVIVNIDPFQGGAFGFAFFYLTLCFTLLGIFSVLFFFFDYLVGNRTEPLYKKVKRSFKYALIASVGLDVALFLQSKKMINFWTITALILLIAFLVSFFLSLKNKRKTI